MGCCCCCCKVASVVSDSVQPHRKQHTRLPHPWGSPGKKTGVGCHALLQGTFPAQGHPHQTQILYQLSYQGISWFSDHTSSLLKPLLRPPSHSVYVLFLRVQPVTSLSSFLVHSTGLLALPQASQAQSQERLFSLPCDHFGWDRFGSLYRNSVVSLLCSGSIVGAAEEL